jgi:LysM repeat protein
MARPEDEGLWTYPAPARAGDPDPFDGAPRADPDDDSLEPARGLQIERRPAVDDDPGSERRLSANDDQTAEHEMAVQPQSEAEAALRGVDASVEELPVTDAEQPETILPRSPAATIAPAPSLGSNAAEWLEVTCPYLRSADGTWRSVVPQRGQRCWGQVPPAPLDPSTQERLCRTAAHSRCDVFLAAEARRADALARDHLSVDRLDGRFGVLVRPVPLVLDSPGHSHVPQVRGSRTRVAAAGVGIAALAIVAVAAALGGGNVPTATNPPPIAFVSPSPAATAGPTNSTPQASGAEPSSSAAPVVTPTPQITPVPQPTPPVARTYRVRDGDTIRSIAAKFGVSRSQLRAVNDFGFPPVLTVGQLVNIPFAPEPSPSPSPSPSSAPAP